MSKYLAHFLLLLALTGIAPLGYGETYTDGFNLYVRGNFVEAERALISASQTEKAASDRANVFKLLGIVQYMQNKKKNAAISFQNALTLNPDIAISNNEILDDSILPFFKSVKKSMPKPQPVVVKKPSPTILRVFSNAKKASVYYNGRHIGAPGQKIKVKPGGGLVTIKAQGYQTKSFKVSLEKSKENKFIFNLAEHSSAKVAAKVRKNLNNQPDDMFANESADNSFKQGGPAPAPPPEPTPQPQPPVDVFQVPVPPPPDTMPTRDGGSDKSIVYAFIPFGGGQYYNGDNLLGAFFTLGELGTLYFYQVSIQGAQLANEQLTQYEADAAEKDKTSTPTESELAQRQAYREDIDTFVKAQGVNANIAIVSFVGLTVLGVAEAYLAMTGPSKPAVADKWKLAPGETLDGYYRSPTPVRHDTQFLLSPQFSGRQGTQFVLSINMPL